MTDRQRLVVVAFDQAANDLIAPRDLTLPRASELSRSALSTATAVSALSLVLRHAAVTTSTPLGEDLWRRGASDLIVGGIRWLSSRQNADGGWGELDEKQSDLATTLLVRAALHLTAVPARHADLLGQAAEYTTRQGGIAEIRRRYGDDKIFTAAVLANWALAEMIRWREVPALPFERVCVPARYLSWLPKSQHVPLDPVMIAVGQARFIHRPPLNPLLRWFRQGCLKRSTAVLEQMLADDQALPSIARTSFIVMSLASAGRIEHPVTRRGVEALLNCVRADGSWPTDPRESL